MGRESVLALATKGQTNINSKTILFITNGFIFLQIYKFYLIILFSGAQNKKGLAVPLLNRHLSMVFYIDAS
jgi:hypothetical protein